MPRTHRTLLLAIALVAVAAGTGAQEPASTPPLAPDCSIYSLEGIRVGMTIDEARAAFRAELKQRGRKLKRGVLWTAHGKSEGDRGRVLMFLVVDGGRVEQVMNFYTHAEGVSMVFSVEPAALVLAFEERFGPANDRSVSSDMFGSPTGDREVVTSTVWYRPACDRVVSVSEGKAWTQVIGSVVESPVLRGTIARLSWLQADLENEKSKVNF